MALRGPPCLQDHPGSFRQGPQITAEEDQVGRFCLCQVDGTGPADPTGGAGDENAAGHEPSWAMGDGGIRWGMTYLLDSTGEKHGLCGEGGTAAQHNGRVGRWPALGSAPG